MRYVMEPFASEREFVWFTEGPDDDGRQWRTGAPMVPPPALVEMSAENEDRLPFADMAPNSFALHVHAPGLRAVLGGLGIGNIEYWPARLIDTSSGAQRDDYRVANYLGRIACLDFKRAIIHKGQRIPIVKLEEFALLEDRILPLPGMAEPPRLFRLAERDSLVIADETVKTACERAGLTGLRFTPTTEY